MKKVIIIGILFLLPNCAFLHYAENPSKKVELDIESFNKKIEKAFTSNVLKNDDGEIKKFLAKAGYLKKEARMVDLLQASYKDLMKQYDYYLKHDKSNLGKSYVMFDKMYNFRIDSDLIKTFYNKQGHGFVYNALTGKNIGFIGVYGAIGNEEQYKSYAIENVNGVREYEELRETIDKKVIEYANNILEKGKKENQKQLFKKTGGKDYCSNTHPDTYSNLSAYLNLNLNPYRDCIYSFGELKVLQVLKDGVLVTGYDRSYGISSTSTAFMYTNKKYVDGDILNSGYNYYVGRYSYFSLLGKRTVNAFREVNKSKYRFLWK